MLGVTGDRLVGHRLLDRNLLRQRGAKSGAAVDDRFLAHLIYRGRCALNADDRRSE